MASADARIRGVAAKHLKQGGVLADIVQSDAAREVRLSAAEALVGVGDPEAAARAMARLAAGSEAEQLAAVHLARVAEPSAAQISMISLLDSASDDVAARAATALGEWGDAGAVEALQRVADGGGLLSAVRPAARSAIRAIQGRSGGSPGRLALAEAPPDLGALSESVSARDRITEPSRR